MKARVLLESHELIVDLMHPVSLARPVEFGASEPQPFAAPPASQRPFTAPGFSGSVAQGASCNCSTITLTPHCNGTHTECVGHLTLETLDAWRIAPQSLLPALLIGVEPIAADATMEGSDPTPPASDQLVTANALARRWPSALPFEPRALLIRTRPRIANSTAPYLSREAAQLLVARGIEHVIVELPSLDRAEDQGRLTAHRIFFGMPTGSHSLADAKRPACTVTELAHIPDRLAEGAYLLQLQLPAIPGDAVSSRPLLYPLLGS